MHPLGLILAAALSVASLLAPGRHAGAEVVNDVTHLNPVEVDHVAVPKTVEDVQHLVRTHDGPISIGGGHFSMGGQTASEHTLHLDMRGLNRIVAFNPAAKTITVQAGITWRAIQEAIDSHDLSLKIMQSYANFTVGGSLSVNVHGRYMGQGPLIGSVRSITVVLADGQLVEASPTQRPEIFFGCIGGYGGLGVIVEATLELADNVKVARRVATMPATAYKDYFLSTVKPSTRTIFHNADIYPPDYDQVVAISWSATEKPVTVEDRLMPVKQRYWLDQLSYFWLTEVPFGKQIREYVIDPWRLRGDPVVWRNYEASYDVRQLEPRARDRSTYVLEEYFVPIARFDEFVPKMAEIFMRHQANIVNVSIRHAVPDQGSIMAWAREEVFAFVVYYKQGTSPADQTAVGIWTRELIDAVLSVGGTYYLPYQLHATEAQFLRAYPRAREFFALKAHLDPDNRFRNKLWDKYYHPPTQPPAPPTMTSMRNDPAPLDVKKNYRREPGTPGARTRPS